jgi:hypothetical protein
MRADNVDERELIAMIDAVWVQLRSKSAAGSEAVYRTGVGIMLLNPRHEIFVGRRADSGRCHKAGSVVAEAPIRRRCAN